MSSMAHDPLTTTTRRDGSTLQSIVIRANDGSETVLAVISVNALTEVLCDRVVEFISNDLASLQLRSSWWRGSGGDVAMGGSIEVNGGPAFDATGEEGENVQRAERATERAGADIEIVQRAEQATTRTVEFRWVPDLELRNGAMLSVILCGRVPPNCLYPHEIFIPQEDSSKRGTIQTNDAPNPFRMLCVSMGERVGHRRRRTRGARSTIPTNDAPNPYRMLCVSMGERVGHRRRRTHGAGEFEWEREMEVVGNWVDGDGGTVSDILMPSGRRRRIRR